MALEAALYYSNDIVGSNTKGGRADSSPVIEFEHEVYSPTDDQRGIVSGARVHGNVILTKEIDTASANLYKACCNGETLDELKIEWYEISPTGQEQVYFTHTLTNVKVAGVEQILPNTKDPNKEKFRHLERLKLLYERINWKHEGGYEYEDAWTDEQ
ncbi:MAG: type VI secretion system tube protein TssD [Rhodothermales bacterium]